MSDEKKTITVEVRKRTPEERAKFRAEVESIVHRLKKERTRRASLAARLAIVDTDPPFERAGGDVVCEACGLKYIDHAEHPARTFLTVLCDGSVVKL